MFKDTTNRPAVNRLRSNGRRSFRITENTLEQAKSKSYESRNKITRYNFSILEQNSQSIKSDIRSYSDIFHIY